MPRRSPKYSRVKRSKRSRKARRSTVQGGKRKLNAGLSDWIQFVKKVQKEHGISYKEAMVKASKMKKKA